jgi:acyl carrier protein
MRQESQHAPTRSEVRERLAHLINEIVGIPLERIRDDATVDGDLKMQSVAFVELQVTIEEDYNIVIDPIQIVELNGFGAIVDYVRDCIVGAGR